MGSLVKGTEWYTCITLNLVLNTSTITMATSQAKNCTGKGDYLTSYTVFVWILSGLIILANVLLIIVILKSKGLRSQRFNLIMISLACTDLFVGFITPFNTIRMGRWTLGYHFCQFVTSMVVILLSASIYNFVFVNLDRLFAIKMPLRYKEMKDKRWVVKLAILACWLLSLVPAMPMWIKSMDTRTKENDGTGCKCSFPYESAQWVWWSSVTTFIIPTVFIIVTWLAILHHFSKDNGSNEAKMISSGRKRREKRITIIMGTITLTFLVCVWPYAIIFMMRDNRPVVLQKVVTLLYSNSLINPILYICINKQVRKSIMKMFTCQEQEHESSEFFSTDEPDGGKLSQMRRTISNMGRSISVKDKH